MSISVCAGVTTPPIVWTASCCTTPSTGAVSVCCCWRVCAFTSSCSRRSARLSASSLALIAARSNSATRLSRRRLDWRTARERLMARRLQPRRHQRLALARRVGGGCGGGRVELDQHVARLHGLPVLYEDALHHADFRRLDHLGLVGRDDLAR